MASGSDPTPGVKMLPDMANAANPAARGARMGRGSYPKPRKPRKIALIGS